MNFNHVEFLLPIIFFLAIFSVFYLSKRKKFFSWVKDHWDLSESPLFRWSEYFLVVCFIALGFLILDPRGEARKVKADVQTLRTIIMVDTSSSMLVEDVRPNRLGKAVMLAKHYVKNAVGQQIAIMVFSDTYKKIVPFTSDIDLLEARLNALEDLRINAGGTALKLSVQEALQYLKAEKKSDPSGNILVFTDAEENDIKGELTVPENVSLALVGVGTAKGGVIPIRDNKGVFRTNKKYQNKLVVSKLNEKVLEEITNDAPNGKYWIANNYNIPTGEIINFFNKSQKEREQKGQVLVKPIMILPFFLVFFILFIIASIIKLKKPIVALMLLISISGFAQNQPAPPEQVEPEEKPRNEEVVQMEERLQKGELSVKEKKDLAYLYLKNGEVKNAEKLYNEVPIAKEEINVRFNKSKTLLTGQKIKEGLEGLQSVKEDLGDDPKYDEVKKKINSEILTHLKRQKEQEKQKKQDEKNKEQKDKNKDGSSGSGEDQDKKDKNKENDQKDKDEKKKQDQKKDGDKKNKPDDKKQDKSEQKNSRSKQRMKIKQLPALLKQLMSEDRQLQKKLLDTSTEERGNYNKKDW